MKTERMGPHHDVLSTNIILTIIIMVMDGLRQLQINTSNLS